MCFHTDGRTYYHKPTEGTYPHSAHTPTGRHTVWRGPRGRCGPEGEGGVARAGGVGRRGEGGVARAGWTGIWARRDCLF